MPTVYEVLSGKASAGKPKANKKAAAATVRPRERPRRREFRPAGGRTDGFQRAGRPPRSRARGRARRSHPPSDPPIRFSALFSSRRRPRASLRRRVARARAPPSRASPAVCPRWKTRSSALTVEFFASLPVLRRRRRPRRRRGWTTSRSSPRPGSGNPPRGSSFPRTGT